MSPGYLLLSTYFDELNLGQRTCPGRFIGLDFVWIVVASLLSTYNISKTVDESGETIEVNPEYTSILIRYVDLSFFESISGRSIDVPVFSATLNHLNAALSPVQKTREHLSNKPKTWRFET